MATVQQRERRFRAVEVIKRRLAKHQALLDSGVAPQGYGLFPGQTREAKIARAEQELANIAAKHD